MPGPASPDIAIIVLGAAVWPGGVPSPSLRRRAEHAARLFHSQGATWLVLCGGIGKSPPSEANCAAEICLAEGVPASAMLLDETSTSTHENLVNAQKLLASKPIGQALIVTDYYHIPRAVLTARALGLPATGAAPKRDLGKTKLHRHIFSIVREGPALVYYLCRAALARFRRRKP